MLIDCDTCHVRGPACGDCMVTFLSVGSPPSAEPATRAPTLSLVPVEERALDVLVRAGLVPPSRYSDVG